LIFDLKPDPEVILNKARHYCSYQERCKQEVMDKMRYWKAPKEMAEKIVQQLIDENFLNEERFARAFASGKFKINHWGKKKIRYELGHRGIPEQTILKGLEELEDNDYEDSLHQLLAKKNREIKEQDHFKRKKKLISFALQKGYDYSLIKKTIDEITSGS